MAGVFLPVAVEWVVREPRYHTPLDTRQKIISADDAIRAIGRPARLKLIIGYFDPMHTAHARRLAELRRDGETMAIAIGDPASPILPRRARAELVAALRVVDYVISVDDNAIAALVESLQPQEVIREDAADEQRTRALIEHVRRRHSASQE